jgi:EipB-like
MLSESYAGEVMSRVRIAILLASSMLVGSSAAASPPAPLAAHRVVYDLSLAKAVGTRGVENARGRIAFDFLGDACDGYALTYRQVTVLEGGEVGTRTSDLRSTTFESGDGKSFRFRSESDLQGSPAKRLDGDAERGTDGTLAVRLKQPRRDRLTFGDDPVFPSDHMKRLIAAGQSGETTLSIRVYDGSDDGRKVYDTLAVLGRKIDPGKEEGVEAPLRTEPMRKLARWPVTLSYFQEGRGEQTPVYVISFELYENGVSRALKLDYGEFALKGDVTRFELMPGKDCQR